MVRDDGWQEPQSSQSLFRRQFKQVKADDHTNQLLRKFPRTRHAPVYLVRPDCGQKATKKPEKSAQLKIRNVITPYIA